MILRSKHTHWPSSADFTKGDISKHNIVLVVVLVVVLELPGKLEDDDDDEDEQEPVFCNARAALSSCHCLPIRWSRRRFVDTCGAYLAFVRFGCGFFGPRTFFLNFKRQTCLAKLRSVATISKLVREQRHTVFRTPSDVGGRRWRRSRMVDVPVKTGRRARFDDTSAVAGRISPVPARRERAGPIAQQTQRG